MDEEESTSSSEMKSDAPNLDKVKLPQKIQSEFEAALAETYLECSKLQVELESYFLASFSTTVGTLNCNNCE